MKTVVLRDGPLPAETFVVVRGGASTLSDDHVRDQALECHARHGFFGISVFVEAPERVADLFRRHPIASRYQGRPVMLSRVGTVLAAGLPILATGAPPHFDVVLADLRTGHLQRLRDCFDGPVVASPESLPSLRRPHTLGE